MVSKGGAKPNVILYIDDSTSMNERTADGRTRLQVTKDVLNNVVDRYQDKMRWAVYTINGTSKMPFSSQYEDPKNWTLAKNAINRIRGDGQTPSTKGYMSFTTDLINAIQYRCQKSFVVFMSDGDAYQSDPYYTRMTVSAFFTNYNTYKSSPKATGSIQLPPDGTPGTENSLGQYSRKLYTQDIKVGGVDAAGKSWDDDPNPDFRKQIAETYTIGFGDSFFDFGRDYLRNTASTDEHYMLAESNDKLTEAFDGIFDKVSSSSQLGKVEAYSVAAPAVSTNNIEGLAASATLNTGTWSSQLQFYQINPKTNAVNTKTWQYADFPTTRNILTSANQKYQLLEDLKLDNSFFGIDNLNGKDEWKEALLPWLTRSKTDAAVEQYGKSVQSKISYRLREDKDRQLGDIIDNPILTFGELSQNNKRAEYLVTSANDGMLYVFKNTQNAVNSDASPYRLHFNYLPMSMQRQSIDDKETVAKQYKRVANKDYGSNKTDNSHVFLMNGGMAIRTTAPNKNKQKQSFVAANMGQGARGMFVLNLSGKNLVTGENVGVETEKSSWPKTVPLFETGKGGSNELGYTVSTPQIGRVSVNRNNETQLLEQNVRYATFLANGYNSPSKAETALYVYDALGADAGLAENTDLHYKYKSGDLIRKLTVPNSTLGLSTPLLVDANFDGLVDVAYAGGYDGNLYRFDLRAKDPSQWSVHMVYKGNPNQPITSAPAVSRIEVENGKKITGKYVVIFGTGTDLYQKDLTSKQGQNIIGIYDNIDSADTVSGYSELLEQTFTTKKIGDESFRFLSNHQLAKNHKGWFIDLDLSSGSTNDGERVTTAPEMFLETAVFTTRIYDSETTKVIENGNVGGSVGDVCASTEQAIKSYSQSWVLAINAKNGGALTNQNSRIEFMSDNQVVKSNDYFANGQKYDSLSNFTIIQQNNNQSYTRDGAIRPVGEDDILGKLKPESNRCTEETDNKIVVNDTIGGMNMTNVIGPKCQKNPPSIKRLSWRQLY